MEPGNELFYNGKWVLRTNSTGIEFNHTSTLWERFIAIIKYIYYSTKNWLGEG